jgi:hypothetical protein
MERRFTSGLLATTSMHVLRQTPGAPANEQVVGVNAVPAAMISSGTQSPEPPLRMHVEKSLARFAGTSDGSTQCALPVVQQEGPSVDGSAEVPQEPDPPSPGGGASRDVAESPPVVPSGVPAPSDPLPSGT